MYKRQSIYYPAKDFIFYSADVHGNALSTQRLKVREALLDRKGGTIVTSIDAGMEFVLSQKIYEQAKQQVAEGETYDLETLCKNLVNMGYVRQAQVEMPGDFSVRGGILDVFPVTEDCPYRIEFWDDEIDSIEEVDPVSGIRLASFDEYKIYPANLFMTTKESQLQAIYQIEDDLAKEVAKFEEEGKHYEAKRLYERVTYDMEMIRELGHCSGIENYSRYFDGRVAGTRPYCLLDFFPDDFLIVIDESHVSVPQIRAMYGGDRARKTNLVEYGFRMESAFDNRPLKFEEFQELAKQVVYVSATPADYELIQSEGIVVEQVIRPTGLLDPVIEVRPSMNQIDDLMEEIQQRIEKEERVLVTTLTKRMACLLYTSDAADEL